MWLPNQLSSSPTFETPTTAFTRDFTGVARSPTRRSKSSVSFHIGTRNTVCRAWPMYSCVICSSIACLVFCKRPEQRRSRLAHLKIDGTVLDLDHDVVVELAVERAEIVVGGASAIVLQIAPIHLVVVDEAAIEDQSAVRLQRARDHVGRVGVRSAVDRRTDAALRIGLDDEAAQIGNGAIDLVGFRLPPGDDLRDPADRTYRARRPSAGSRNRPTAPCGLPTAAAYSRSARSRAKSPAPECADSR